jgi:hypothetical protein
VERRAGAKAMQKVRGAGVHESLSHRARPEPPPYPPPQAGCSSHTSLAPS